MCLALGTVCAVHYKPSRHRSALTPPLLTHLNNPRVLQRSRRRHSHSVLQRLSPLTRLPTDMCLALGTVCAVLPSHSLPTPRSALTAPLVTHLNNPRAHARRRHSHSVLQRLSPLTRLPTNMYLALCTVCAVLLPPMPMRLALAASRPVGVASACTGRHST